MPRKCYNKPNRSYVRKFTVIDAARVSCYAFREGGTFRGLLESIEECAGDVVAEYIADELEKRIKPELCKAAKKLDTGFRGKLVRLVSFVRPFRLLVDSLDGLVADIESFNLAGIRVPRTITTPLRRIVDNLVELLDTIDEFVLDVTSELDILRGYCDGSTD
jgi:hypothetical protein